MSNPEGTRRETLLAVAFYGVPALLFFLPCLAGKTQVPTDFLSVTGLVEGPAVPHNFRTFDAIEQTFPRNVALAEASAAGVEPAWDAGRFGGFPLAADPAVGAWYPPKRLALMCFSPNRAYDLMLCLHFWALGPSMFYWLRARGRSFAAALLGGAVWMFGGQAQYWFKYETALAAMVYLPLVLCAADRMLSGGAWAAALATGTLGGLMLLCGSPYPIFFNMLMIAAFAAARLRTPEARRRGAGALASRIVLAAAVAAAIGWAQWGPALEFLRDSSLNRLSADPPAPHRRNLLLFPLLFSPRIAGGPLDRVDVVASHFPDTNINEWMGYGGIFALACAGWAVARPARRRWPWIAAILFILGIAFEAPPFYDAWRVVPKLGTWLTPPRFLYFYCAALAVLAADGLDDLRHLDDDGRRRLRGRLRYLAAAWAGLVLLAVLAAVAARRIPPGDTVLWHRALRWLNITTPAVWMTLGAAGAALAALSGFARPGLPSRVTLALALLVAVADPASYFFSYHAPQDAGLLRHPPPLVEWLRGRPGGPFRIAARFEVPYWNLPMDNLLQPWGLENANGYAGAYPGEIATAFRRDGQSVQRIRAEFTRLPSRLADLLNVRYVVGEGISPPPGWQAQPFGRLMVCENPGAMPRVWGVTRWTAAGGEDEAWARAADPAFDPAREAVVEGIPPSDAAPSPVAVSNVRLAPGTAAAEVDSPAPAVILFSQLFLPDWRASVDGRESARVRADGTIIGVPVPAGRHRVEIRYRGGGSAVWTWIGGTTLAACLAALAAMGARARLRRRTPANGNSLERPPTRD